MYVRHAIAFEMSADAPVRPARPQLRLVWPVGALTPGERQAVMIGRGDATCFGWSGDMPRSAFGRLIRRAFARLTGIRGVTPLADPQLEQLRLFACMMRRNDRRSDSVAQQLIATGLTTGALHQAIGIALG